MTTASFTKFVRTLEGQYQVSLGHALAKESSVDNVSRMLPIKDPIIILNKEKMGSYNPNMENKTLSLICNYVQCHSVGLQCSTTVRPKGHCCDICGGVLKFASNKFTVDSIAGAIQQTMKENNLMDLLHYSIDRVDNDGVVPHYQIAVFPTKKYDDTVFQIFIMELDYKLSNSKGNSLEYFSVSYDWSRLDHSYSQGN
ncbi:hypothetical protein Y032_0075g952 [Ancylostoma ceylanicum]|uniref:Uncharacterized protein n=1 Tax=Ancylostoma ceylanicum TaxID=53326 RepID=A0A016TU86_9BILA|nr:hypothetical protein Y032_0075g952 [Ancylostoma ceylanicum]